MTDRWLTLYVPLLVLLLLPTLGLYAGPAYGPLGLGCGVLLCLYGGWQRQDGLHLPVSLTALAAGVLLAAFASALWSVDRSLTLRASGQMALVLSGCLALLTARPLLHRDVEPLLARWFPWALAVGAVFMLLDGQLDYALSHALGRGETAPVKYNRGVNYLMILLWPMLALLLAWRQRLGLAVLGLGLGVILWRNQSSTAYVQLAGGGLVLGLGWLAGHRWPSLLPRLLIAGSMLVGTVLPFALSAMTHEHRQAVWRTLKHSAAHRLEIWDYLSHYVLQQPWLGWGFGTATALKPTAEQLTTYRRVDPNGIYPHNQWLEAWLGLGTVGMLAGLVLMLLVGRGLLRLPPHLRPYGCAAFASAQILCLTSFEITTDSWWAALALCAVLLHGISRRN